MIQAHDIHRSYGSLEILKGIDLSVEGGAVVSIVGASGAGKTTLLQVLGTLDLPDRGSLSVRDTDVLKLSSRELARFRNQHIGFIFQFHHLLPEFTALENVCIPGFIGKKQRQEVEAEATKLLERMGMSERFEHKPAQLSGGEQQRVAVARALINGPSIVFADEPSGNLDSQTSDELHQLFFDLRNAFGQTFVIATHNDAFASMADRKLRIRDGSIEKEEHIEAEGKN
ncbi:MAG: ABC transporter ATP-binding protein [Flavobacteriales bacterium]